ncbi:DNA-binding transcriptional MerR regulator [Lederbergia galactosidilyticus]|uniref:MerR family transcriptional regulator n=1 Tax=Lederbergia galactosidilytica TaxID=217031 RepID=UPI001AEAE12A|nr:MerR family transcriptional regulator [Lederbergia galactosidilytica]MBP1917105.1 DNA-binding transcriptional MerR regulator [Lederbergia galactosidilytica]
MIYSPKQISEYLNVSTTTLRRYEEQGLIVDVPRTNGNHRYYTQIHFQAFITIRALLQCYEIPVVYEVMRKIKVQNIKAAFWLINEQQFELEKEKKRVVEILDVIKTTDFKSYEGIKVNDRMSIGQVAEIAGVNTSAIRHWENEGLICSKRDKDNGYRMYTVNELRKILLISSLRKTVYYIENIRELLKDLDTKSFKKIDRSFTLALENLDKKLQKQFFGIGELIKYIELF